MALEEAQAFSGEASFLDATAGQGFEGMDATTLQIPFVSILQSTSDAVQGGIAQAGNWYNGVTRKVYGPSLKVIVTGFQVCWSEKDSMGKTIRRIPVGSEPVDGDQYKGMWIRGDVTRKVQETWLYQLVLPEDPEIGFAIYASSPGNMRYLKAWDTQMKFLHLPSGKPAQLFSSIWELTINQDMNKEGKKYYSLKDGIRRIGWIPEAIYNQAVLPTVEQKYALLSAPTTSEDSGTEETVAETTAY